MMDLFSGFAEWQTWVAMGFALIAGLLMPTRTTMGNWKQRNWPWLSAIMIFYLGVLFMGAIHHTGIFHD